MANARADEQKEEVQIGNKAYTVYFQKEVDPKNHGVRCPNCSKDEAFRAIITIAEVIESDTQVPIGLTYAVKRNTEAELRRKLVNEGHLVTEELGCKCAQEKQLEE